MSVRRTTFTGRAVIVVCVVAALAITLAVPVRELLSQRSEIAALQVEVDETQSRVADLTERAADWNDPAYVIAQARSRLHFVFPGEVGYVVLGADERPLTAEGTTATPPVLPWYDRMWQSLRLADKGPDALAGESAVDIR
jgi:cell division protein FtsB